MATLPTALALTNVGTGASVLSSDHRNNYSALQTAVNSLISTLGTGAAGQVLKGSGTTVSYDYPPGYQFNYKQIVGNATVTATVEASANAIVTADPVTLDGATQVSIQFFAPSWQATGGQVFSLTLWDGATDLGVVYAYLPQSLGSQFGSIMVEQVLTPTAGAHTFSIRGHSIAASTVTIAAGAGGAGVTMPAFMRIVKAA